MADCKQDTFNVISVRKNTNVSSAYSVVLTGAANNTGSADVMNARIDCNMPITTGIFKLDDYQGNPNEYWHMINYSVSGSVYKEMVHTTPPTLINISPLTGTNVQGSFGGQLFIFSGPGKSLLDITGRFNVGFKYK